MTENIKHLKLTNNDEIVCEIVSYPNNEESDEIIIKKALKIKIHFSNSEKFFLKNLKGKEDPEEKRKVIGKNFD